jgi:hypothetical protein
MHSKRAFSCFALRLALIVWTLVLLCPLDGITQALRISEVMSDNAGVLLDEDGDSPDWLELHNPSSVEVNVGGWHLTDDAGDLMQWTLPNTSIPPGGFLVGFASDKNRSVAGSELHTNFRLSASGEYLAVVWPDGTTVEDEVVIPALEEDVAYGYAFSNGVNAVVLDSGAPCRAHMPASGGDAVGRRGLAFDDSSWVVVDEVTYFDREP